MSSGGESESCVFHTFSFYLAYFLKRFGRVTLEQSHLPFNPPYGKPRLQHELFAILSLRPLNGGRFVIHVGDSKGSRPTKHYRYFGRRYGFLSDLGCFGSEIPTPNLDALANNGVRFTQFYNTGRCCPTRASLLTGLYPHQAGVGHMTDDKHLPGYEGRLNDRCATIAEVLRPSGYFTSMVGNGHVGQNLGVTPLGGRGFDRSLNAAAGGFICPDPTKPNSFSMEMLFRMPIPACRKTGTRPIYGHRRD